MTSFCRPLFARHGDDATCDEKSKSCSHEAGDRRSVHPSRTFADFSAKTAFSSVVNYVIMTISLNIDGLTSVFAVSASLFLKVSIMNLYWSLWENQPEIIGRRRKDLNVCDEIKSKVNFCRGNWNIFQKFEGTEEKLRPGVQLQPHKYQCDLLIRFAAGCFKASGLFCCCRLCSDLHPARMQKPNGIIILCCFQRRLTHNRSRFTWGSCKPANQTSSRRLPP